jgi:hypothetical protein
MHYLIIALVVGLAGTLPLLVRKRFATAAKLAAVVTLLTSVITYVALPSLAFPYWGLPSFLVVASWAAAGVLAYARDERDRESSSYGSRSHRRSREPSAYEGISERRSLLLAAALPALGVALLLLRLAASWTAFRAPDYVALIGDVQRSDWGKDVQRADPRHIRLVPQEMALWLANKQLGEAPGAVGSQFQITEESLTLQMIRGELWYVAALDFKDFGAWQSAGVSPGYVMVHGEDPLRQVVVKTDQKFAFTPNACFGKNLERHLWTSGYSMHGLVDYSLELDEAGKPWWVVSVYEPTIGWDGDRVLGVVIVDPENGAHAFSPVGAVPHWVDRVFPKSFVRQYIASWGALSAGWLNGWWYKKDVTEPETPSIVYGADGEPYWVTGVTSTNEHDESLIGLMYTHTRTGKSVFYRAVGGTDAAVLQAVDNKVTYRKLHGASPVLYNLYGTMASIVPLLGESHTFQGVAIVRIDNLQVAVGDTPLEALEEYRKLIPEHVDRIEPTASDLARTIEGKVSRIADIGNGTYYVYLEGVPAIFVGSRENARTMPLTKPGDRVRLKYLASGESPPIVEFENLSLPVVSGPPPEK